MSQQTVGQSNPTWPRQVDEQTDDTNGPPWCAADGSGWNGDNLLDDDDVIAHATVRIDDLTAAPVLTDLRGAAGVRQPSEVKFKHFRRPAGLKALVAALLPGGPLNTRVTIAVADKKYAIVANMINMLVEQRAVAHGKNLHANDDARQMARTLYRDGRRALGEHWDSLSAAFVNLARVTIRNIDHKETVESFFERLEWARWKCTRSNVERVLIELLRTRDQANWLVDSLGRGALALPPLDPLITLLNVSLQSCSAQGFVRILHDQQKLFAPHVIQAFFEGLQHRPALRRPIPRVRVADFCVGNSKQHPSIQLADLMASAGRVVVEAQLGKPTPDAEILRNAIIPHIAQPWLLPFDGPLASPVN